MTANPLVSTIDHHSLEDLLAADHDEFVQLVDAWVRHSGAATDHDPGDPFAATEIRERTALVLDALALDTQGQIERHELTARMGELDKDMTAVYKALNQARAASRFRSGVIARRSQLRFADLAGHDRDDWDDWDGAVTDDRARVDELAELRAAIDAHRAAIGDDDATSADRELWARAG